MTDGRTPFDVPGRAPVSGLPTGDLLGTGTVTVDLPVPSSALAIGAHPDDIEFGAGATLARWAAAGCRVHHLVLTDGSKGSWDPDQDLGALTAARAEECLAAAARIDGRRTSDPTPPDRVQFLGQVDGELVDDESTRRQVTRVLRTVRPQVVLGHDPWRRYRLHPDHRAAGFLTLDAIVAGRDPHFFGDLGLAPHRPDALLLWEADLPNHVERAGDFAEAKVDALLCHHSQLESTMGIDGTGVTTDGRARFAGQIDWQLDQHGALAGVGPAEAFHLMLDL